MKIYIIWCYQHCFCKNCRYNISVCRSFFKTEIAKTCSLYLSLGHACMSNNAVKVRRYYISIKILSKILKMVPWLFSVILKTILRITFKVFFWYLICPNKYNAYVCPWKCFFSIFYSNLCSCWVPFTFVLFTSKCRIVSEVYKLIPGSIQPSTWLQLNKLLMKLWKGVSRAFTLLIRSKFGHDNADHRSTFSLLKVAELNFWDWHLFTIFTA